MHNLVTTVFNEEITEQGLRELREKYPSDVVHDMSDNEQFKAARKIRTERNKLVDAIDRKRKDITSELKAKGDSLVEEVNGIYSHIIEPFEAEDKRRKEEAARLKREHEEMLRKEQQRVNEIRAFVSNCRGKDSGYIESMIESVDLIETDCFHKDAIHDAIEAKRDTIEQLTILLADTKAREKLEAERAAVAAEKAKIEAERAEFEAWKAQQEQAKREQASVSQQRQLTEAQKQPKSDPKPTTRQLSAMEVNGIVQFVLAVKAANKPYADDLQAFANEFTNGNERKAA